MKKLILVLLLTPIIIYVLALLFIKIKYGWIPKTKAFFYERIGFIGFWMGSIGKKVLLWAKDKLTRMVIK